MTIPKISDSSHAYTRRIRIRRGKMFAYSSLAMNFLRSRFGNRLTLSVFVSMFDKYRIIF